MLLAQPALCKRITFCINPLKIQDSSAAWDFFVGFLKSLALPGLMVIGQVGELLGVGVESDYQSLGMIGGAYDVSITET
ncbi:MAG: hypothetical protein WAT36_12405 [Chromatiaceae bacterium]